jgi:hypothetical protein
MVNSVAEFVAGEEYEFSEEQGDRFLALGYAEGEVSGDYDAESWAAYTAEQAASHQKVGL